MNNGFLILVAVFVVGMFFMTSRSRKKQQAQQDDLQNSLAVGDVVVMTSGISGTIVDLEDEKTLDLEIAPDVVTTWLRLAVREKLSATETPEIPENVGELDATDATTSPATPTTSAAATSSDATVAADEPASSTAPDAVTTSKATSATGTSGSTDTADGTGTAPGSRDDAVSPSLRKSGS